MPRTPTELAAPLAAGRNGPAVVVAADSARARVFRAGTPDAPLEEVDALLNPEARLHEGDLVEDSAGRRGTRPTQAKRSALGGETAKRHRAEEFAALVCDRVARQLRAARAGRLYLVAEPEFLGLLRRRFGRSVLRQVAGAVAKSVADQPPGRIRAVLPARL
jgi:protein required for attachment to host cells